MKPPKTMFEKLQEHYEGRGEDFDSSVGIVEKFEELCEEDELNGK